jgi:hypothetical protein
LNTFTRPWVTLDEDGLLGVERAKAASPHHLQDGDVVEPGEETRLLQDGHQLPLQLGSPTCPLLRHLAPPRAAELRS